MPTSEDDRSGATGRFLSAARWLGLVLLGGAGFLYLFSGLVAPPWGVGVLWAVFVVIVIIVIRTWRSRPWVAVLAGPVAWAIWAGFLLFGDVVLGWTA